MKTIFRLAAIIGTLPQTLTNGTTADATQVMADLNWIVNQVNANAAPLATTALTNANNNFTVVQSGVAATSGSNFPLASQVQNQSFNTLSSTLGTNTITSRVSALALAAYGAGQVFTFIPSQTNTGPSNITVDAAGSTIIFTMGSTLVGGEIVKGVPALIEHDGAKANLLNPFMQFTAPLSKVGGTVSLGLNSTFLSGTSGLLLPVGVSLKSSAVSDTVLGNTATYFDIVSVSQGTTGTWFVTGGVTFNTSAAAARIDAKLWDGTTIIDSRSVTLTAVAGIDGSISLSGTITNPAAQLRISVRDASSTNNCSTVFNASGNSHDCTITALRIG